MHMISTQCVAHDLHKISPWPLEHTCWRQFTVQWGDCTNLEQHLSMSLIIIISEIGSSPAVESKDLNSRFFLPYLFPSLLSALLCSFFPMHFCLTDPFICILSTTLLYQYLKSEYVYPFKGLHSPQPVPEVRMWLPIQRLTLLKQYLKSACDCPFKKTYNLLNQYLKSEWDYPQKCLILSSTSTSSKNVITHSKAFTLLNQYLKSECDYPFKGLYPPQPVPEVRMRPPIQKLAVTKAKADL